MDHVLDPDPPPSYRKLPVSNDARRKFPVIRRPKQKHRPLVSIQTRLGQLSIRDAEPSEADAYVHYWHCGGEELKNLLGIDTKKLGTIEDSRKRFLKMIRIPGVEQADVIFTVALNDEMIGYTNINRQGPEDNYVHLHTYRGPLRSAIRTGKSSSGAKTGASLASVLIGPGMYMYFNLFPIRRLALPTRPQNRWINSALDLYMRPAETRYVDTPIGLAVPGELHLRYVRREDVPWMLRRADLLTTGKGLRTAIHESRRLPEQGAPGDRAPLSSPPVNAVPPEVLLTGR